MPLSRRVQFSSRFLKSSQASQLSCMGILRWPSWHHCYVQFLEARRFRFITWRLQELWWESWSCLLLARWAKMLLALYPSRCVRQLMDWEPRALKLPSKLYCQRRFQGLPPHLSLAYPAQLVRRWLLPLLLVRVRILLLIHSRQPKQWPAILRASVVETFPITRLITTRFLRSGYCSF